MNRRGFLSRVGAAAAILPAAPLLLKAVESPEPLNGNGLQVVTGHGRRQDDLCKLPPTDARDHTHTIGTGISHTHSGNAPKTYLLCSDLLALRQSRGLLKPCPNCQIAQWHRSDNFNAIACDGCGWLEDERKLVLDCPCTDCRGGRGELLTVSLPVVTATTPAGSPGYEAGYGTCDCIAQARAELERQR